MKPLRGAERILQHVPRMRIAITGGPGSGKTTLVDALAARGFATVPESAIQVIGELARELGLEGQKRWRREQPVEFQRRVLARQLADEASVGAGASAPLFLDRSCIDGLAYCRHFGVEPPAELAQAARAERLERVFLLDTLPMLGDRGASGRTSDRETSLAVRDLLDAVYRELGHTPLRVPVAPVEERVRFVLVASGLAVD